jgi:hypothetical protein
LRDCAFNFETLLLGSLILPKTMASAGQDCWQAVCNSPSAVVDLAILPLGIDAMLD